MAVDLLVQLGDCTRGHPRTPQGLGDVFDPPDRYPGQVHLDQRLLDRGLAALVALDDGRLESLLAQLRYLQVDLTGLRVKLAIVVPRAGIDPIRTALIALGAAH